ncbi:acyl-CoA dehydrogenase family protein [Alcaligenaceae bacterium]|nr:acyl-CoA dehydrogenase family protein [Alcaligenaceae bacterium]
MNFETNEEIDGVRDSLIRVLSDHYTSSHRQALADSGTAYAEQAWKEMTGLGLTGLLVPQDFDGLGRDFTDLLPVFLELGRSLAPVPFMSSCVLGATALRRADNTELQKMLMPSLVAGTLQLSCSHTSASTIPSVSAQWHDGAWRLAGVQQHLPYAATADRLILAARVSGSASEQDGLYILAREAVGVRLRSHRLIDGTPAADVYLDDAEAIALCAPGSVQARTAIEAVAAAGIAAACAEMVGIMEAAFRLTVDYLKTRQQFGRLIGENQALRHRSADMLVALETARSLSIAAALAAGHGGSGTAESRADLHRAKFLVGRNARILCQAAIQLHGGIGMTEEYKVGHYLRRVHVLDHQFGNEAQHLQELAKLT